MSLAAFMPLGPVVTKSLKTRHTKIQLLRQTTVDVRFVLLVISARLCLIHLLDRNALIVGTRTDILRVDCIGEGAFRHAVCNAVHLAKGI